MAVEQDYVAYETYWSKWALLAQPRLTNAVVLSPDRERRQSFTLMKWIQFASDSSLKITNLGQDAWDLNEPAKFNCDLIVACNVFHYSPEPARWFNNVLAVCREFWIQDLYVRDRGGPFGLGNDGDRYRYYFGASSLSKDAPWTFNLDHYRNRILDYHTYDAGSMSAGRTCVNFIARMKGDL